MFSYYCARLFPQLTCRHSNLYSLLSYQSEADRKSRRWRRSNRPFHDMNADNDAKPSGADGTSTAKPATKIRIIEDAKATGETAAAYDFWRAGSGDSKFPASSSASDLGLTSYVALSN